MSLSMMSFSGDPLKHESRDSPINAKPVKRGKSAPAAATAASASNKTIEAAPQGKRKLEWGPTAGQDEDEGGHEGRDGEECMGMGNEEMMRMEPEGKRACRREPGVENLAHILRADVETCKGLLMPRELEELKHHNLEQMMNEHSMFQEFEVSQPPMDKSHPLGLPIATSIPEPLCDHEDLLAFLGDSDDEELYADLFDEEFSEALAGSYYEATRRDWWREDALWTLKKVEAVFEYDSTMKESDVTNKFMEGVKRRMFVHRPVGCKRNPPLWKSKVCSDVIVGRTLRFTNRLYVHKTRPKQGKKIVFKIKN